MPGYAFVYGVRISPLVSAYTFVINCLLLQTICMLRRLFANSFRGDVSEKFRCAAPRHPTRYFVGPLKLRSRISLLPEVSSSVVPR